jgi:hypothetical protein
VVGNAGHLSLTKYGKEIDAYDVVVRLNQAPTKGYEERVGTKTTMRIMNRLWSVAYGRYDEQVKRLGLPLEKGVTLVASRGARPCTLPPFRPLTSSCTPRTVF